MTNPSPQDKDWKEKEREEFYKLNLLQPVWEDRSTIDVQAEAIADYWLDRLETHRQEAVEEYRRGLVEGDIEKVAEAVHRAYLTTCEKLGWEVKPSNKVPYSELSEDSKELDRASVWAVLSILSDNPL